MTDILEACLFGNEIPFFIEHSTQVHFKCKLDWDKMWRLRLSFKQPWLWIPLVKKIWALKTFILFKNTKYMIYLTILCLLEMQVTKPRFFYPKYSIEDCKFCTINSITPNFIQMLDIITLQRKITKFCLIYKELQFLVFKEGVLFLRGFIFK